MYLEIISPEATLFTGNIDSLKVPGTNGSFQVLENHASIVSTLTSGNITLQGKFDSSNNFDEPFNKIDSKRFFRKKI
jgi:F-type H+-transporting ATPase subunit epsilon